MVVSAADSDCPVLIDSAKLLSKEEANAVTSELKRVGDKQNIQVVVLTITDAGYEDLDDYVEKFQSTNSYSKNSVFLAINMDPADRRVLVQGHGKCETYIDNKRAQCITDNMVSDMKAGNYSIAIKYYIAQVDSYMSNKTPIILQHLGIELLISMAIAGIIVIIMVINAGGKNTTNFNTYLNPATSRILAKRDIYTHTTTTRHKIQQSSNNSNGGGGSHSSGSSKF